MTLSIARTWVPPFWLLCQLRRAVVIAMLVVIAPVLLKIVATRPASARTQGTLVHAPGPAHRTLIVRTGAGTRFRHVKRVLRKAEREGFDTVVLEAR